MTEKPTDPAYLRVAAFAAWVGLALGLFLLAMLAGIQITVDSTRPGAEILAGPFDNLVIGSLLVLVLVSVMVQVWVRIARGQLRLAEQIGRLQTQACIEPTDPDPGREQSPAQVHGLTPDMVALARDMSARLNHAA